MKKFLTIIAIAVIAFTVPNKAQAQVQTSDDYAAYLGALDTLTNADTTTYIVSIKGVKSQLAVSADVIKISGTVNAKMYVYVSVNGTTYGTTPVDSISTSNTTGAVIYRWDPTKVPTAQKLKFQWISTATQSLSQRTYLLYRKQP